MANTKNTISSCSKVSLRKITEETAKNICKLPVKPEQRNFFHNNAALVIVHAYFLKNVWLRAIYADETPVGILTLENDAKKPKYFLTRFMIGSRYQNMGFGSQAVKLLIKYVKTRPNATEVLLNVNDENSGAIAFYEKLGFKLTGEYLKPSSAVMKYTF